MVHPTSLAHRIRFHRGSRRSARPNAATSHGGRCAPRLRWAQPSTRMGRVGGDALVDSVQRASYAKRCSAAALPRRFSGRRPSRRLRRRQGRRCARCVRVLGCAGSIRRCCVETRTHRRACRPWRHGARLPHGMRADAQPGTTRPTAPRVCVSAVLLGRIDQSRRQRRCTSEA